MPEPPKQSHDIPLVIRIDNLSEDILTLALLDIDLFPPCLSLIVANFAMVSLT